MCCSHKSVPRCTAHFHISLEILKLLANGRVQQLLLLFCCSSYYWPILQWGSSLHPAIASHDAYAVHALTSNICIPSLMTVSACSHLRYLSLTFLLFLSWTYIHYTDTFIPEACKWERDKKIMRDLNIGEKAIVENPNIIHSSNDDNIGLHVDWLRKYQNHK